MPLPGKRWYHLILHTQGSWLPGDPRGFRSRKHRIHSSGDYKNPPPPGEHAKLHAYQKERAMPIVCIPAMYFPVIGKAILDKLKKLEHRAVAISVGVTHVHLLAELPDSFDLAKKIAGQLKQAASLATGPELGGKVWAAGGKPIEVDDAEHHRRVYEYILRHRTEGDWTWAIREHPNVAAWGKDWETREDEGDREL